LGEEKGKSTHYFLNRNSVCKAGQDKKYVEGHFEQVETIDQDSETTWPEDRSARKRV